MEITSILPDDVLEEILLRLPVKHLLQLKCVCKQWYALIGDFGFHKKHYHFQYAMHVAEHDDIPLFLDNQDGVYPRVPTKISLLSKLHGADIFLNITPDFERDISAAFSNDLKLDNILLQCFGIVNGVIGLQLGDAALKNSIKAKRDSKRLALWNPATRELKRIECWPIEVPKEAQRASYERILGFGYDLQSNDFKILVWVRFVGWDGKTTFDECHLYSLKANSWKKIKDAFYTDSLIRTCPSPMDAYLSNGVYYWVASDSDLHSYPLSIISFNFSTEILKEFELPGSRGNTCRYTQQTTSDNEPLLCRCHNDEVKIGKYKEGLAFFLRNHPDCQIFKVEIWEVTKFRDHDYGLPLSCQLVLRVAIQSGHDWFQLNTIRVCGHLLLTFQQYLCSESNLVAYDPSTCTFNLLEPTTYSNFSYKESLFSLSRLT